MEESPINSLEKRIASALVDEGITSAELSALLTEVESATTAADKAAKEERTKALDPTNVDTAAARRELDNATFHRDRLHAALPKLQRHYDQVSDQESYDRWLAMFEGVKSKHAAAAAKLKAIYWEFGPKLVEALLDAQDVDADVRRVMDQKPVLLAQANGDGKDLPTVEHTARSLKSIAPGCSMMRDMHLPLFEAPNALAWPPPTPSLFSQMAMPIISHPGADWWKDNDARKTNAERENARIVNYYKQQQEEREKREAAEARAEREQRRQREAS